ncbi:unnamed protein product [Dibothriocephalus latus]|uniref:EF-hand domain-containing protein n=1 Tax=Dibothriocephalus latus TaxID=60516 RepID=A0A3P7L7Z9_DIBLA|nr:unnamed protein product [Dibothriocephalus latus]
MSRQLSKGLSKKRPLSVELMRAPASERESRLVVALIRAQSECVDAIRLYFRMEFSTLPTDREDSTESRLTATSAASSAREEQRRQVLKSIAHMLDTDGDGLIDGGDLLGVIRGLQQNPTEAEFQDMISEVEMNRDGFLDVDDFCVFLEQKTIGFDIRTRIKTVFDAFDHSGTGLVRAADLHRIMLAFDENITLEECEQLIQEVSYSKEYLTLQGKPFLFMVIPLF